MKYEQKDYDAFIKKIEDLQKRAASESLWIVLENIPEKVRADVAAAMAELAEVINEESCVIFISREKPQMEFLELLWKQKMTLVNMEKLLFTEEEIRVLTEQMGVPFDAKQVLEKTGGWAGCVSLLIQLSKGGQGIDELLDSYEMSAYVKNEMLSGLEEEEFAFLQRAAGCPWVSKKMAEEVWGLTDTEEIMENLWRKGILLHDRERGFWKIAPLFLRYVAVKMSELEKITTWYEREGYIAEALNCRERFGTEEAYRTVVLKYFDQVPLLGFLDEKVLKWKEKTPELCYLRGAYAYSVQDFEGLVREILTLKKNKENDHKSKEILLNLEYLNPERSLAEWIGLLEDLRGPGEKFRLYQMLGNSVTYLCGIRDISGLFACSKKEERQKARLWKESFEETGWKCYQLARIDYYLETGQKDSIPEEDFDLLSEKTDVKDAAPARINITLYGASAKTYKKICGEECGLQKTQKAIELLKTAGINVVINGSMIPENEKDMEDIIRYGKENNIFTRISTYMFPPVRRESEIDDSRCTAEQSAELFIRKNHCLLDDKQFVGFLKNQQSKIGNKISEEEENWGNNLEHMRCRAGRSTFWVSWEGIMTACGMMPFPIEVNPFQKPFDQCWMELTNKVREAKVLHECSKCDKKEICNPCAAMLYAENGDVNKKSQYLCDLTENIICKIEKELKGETENEC